MPVPTAVTQAKVLAQPLRVGLADTVRGVRRDRCRRRVEALETLEATAHERHDLRGTARFDLRCDIDQNQAASEFGILPLPDQRGHPAHRGTDEHRLLPQLCDDRGQVGDQRIDAVIPLRCPLTVAVPPGIQRDGGPAVRGEAATGVSPGMPGLPAAVQQQDQALSADARSAVTRCRWIPPVGDKRDAITGEFGLGDYGIHGVPHQHHRVEHSPPWCTTG
ncbi:hypothetical protein MLGJGCBP_08188 [Rhodococcus sp. T7]|nr:hypothetical protein MLGJGCBP_08188 [Rhodococcus sp. T7]